MIFWFLLCIILVETKTLPDGFGRRRAGCIRRYVGMHRRRWVLRTTVWDVSDVGNGWDTPHITHTRFADYKRGVLFSSFCFICRHNFYISIFPIGYSLHHMNKLIVDNFRKLNKLRRFIMFVCISWGRFYFTFLINKIYNVIIM